MLGIGKDILKEMKREVILVARSKQVNIIDCGSTA
jgi:hypothetical protein